VLYRLRSRKGGMMERLATAAMLAVALAVPIVIGAQIERGALSPAEMDLVTTRIQKIRGLKFEKKVPLAFLTTEQARARIKADIESETKPANLRLSETEGEMIGLFPPGTNLENGDLDFVKVGLAGFYDSKTRDMVIIDRPLTVGVPARARAFVALVEKLNTAGVIAHEMTHALQDQHFQIGAMLKGIRDDGDRTLAYRSLVEGDATLAGFGAVVGRIDDPTIDFYLSHDAEVTAIFMGRTEGFPRALTEMRRFQYSDGARFVAEAFDRKGWNGVNALYRNPPQSTQQIMHPELYFDHPTVPAAIRIAGYERILGGWKKADEDTVGALVLRVIIERVMGDQTPYVQAASWWTGDRLVALQKGNAVTLLWIITFKEGGFAQNFAQLYGSVLDKSLPPLTARHVEHRNDAVLVMLGDGAIRFHELAPALWKATTIAKPAADHAPWPPAHAAAGAPSPPPAAR
jgi:hypothetical protein